MNINANLEKAHFLLGVILKEQGKIEEAISRFKEALRIKPDYKEAETHLYEAYRILEKSKR
ncbi:tetratricopeptide repeat protein [Candidatus Latescibacterota bacterium]